MDRGPATRRVVSALERIHRTSRRRRDFRQRRRVSSQFLGTRVDGGERIEPAAHASHHHGHQLDVFLDAQHGDGSLPPGDDEISGNFRHLWLLRRQPLCDDHFRLLVRPRNQRTDARRAGNRHDQVFEPSRRRASLESTRRRRRFETARRRALSRHSTSIILDLY